jgi:hypothetical protein
MEADNLTFIFDEKILWRGTIDLKYDHLLNVQDNWRSRSSKAWS